MCREGPKLPTPGCGAAGTGGGGGAETSVGLTAEGPPLWGSAWRETEAPPPHPFPGGFPLPPPAAAALRAFQSCCLHRCSGGRSGGVSCEPRTETFGWHRQCCAVLCCARLRAAFGAALRVLPCAESNQRCESAGRDGARRGQCCRGAAAPGCPAALNAGERPHRAACPMAPLTELPLFLQELLGFLFLCHLLSTRVGSPRHPFRCKTAGRQNKELPRTRLCSGVCLTSHAGSSTICIYLLLTLCNVCSRSTDC